MKKKTFKLPQEIEVWYIIPRIRRDMSKEFVQKYGLSYEKTANILGITKAAVSQYLREKRANKIKLSKEIEKDIKDAAKRIFEDKSNFPVEAQAILKKMKENKCSCTFCKKYNREIVNYCKCEPSY